MFRRVLPTLLLIIVLLGTVPAAARDLDYRFPKDQVVAAYLFNFALFSNWPQRVFNDRDAFVIATFDREFAALATTALAGRRVADRPLTVRLLTTIAECTDAHLLLLTDKERGRLAAIFRQLEHQPVLTVGLIPDFTASGGMVELFQVDKRLRFSFNLDAVADAKLRISSEVLHLAEGIKSDRRPVPAR